MMGGRMQWRYRGDKRALTGGAGHRFRVYYDGSVADAKTFKYIENFFIEDRIWLNKIMNAGGKNVDTLVQIYINATEEREARESKKESKQDESIGKICFHFKPYYS